MNFLLDADTSPALGKLIQILHPAATFRHVRSEWGDGAKDVDWLCQVARWRPRPVIIASDASILRNPTELKALQESACSFVVLDHSIHQLPIHLQVSRLAQSWPLLKKELEYRASPCYLRLIRRHPYIKRIRI